MGTAPGTLKLVKAGFVVLDATGAVQRIIAFQYNPETLVRRLVASTATFVGTGVGSAGVAQAVGVAPVVPPAPSESVSFTLTLDAADKLERADAVTLQNGVLPMIATLEMLLSPPPGAMTVWVSGSHRVVPVRISEMTFNEQAFDPTLNPIRAEVSVQLQVLKDADFPANSRGRAIWDAHYSQLQQLAKLLDAGTLAALGLSGI